MATVNVKEPEMITFEYRQEKEDEDYGSCMWARFNLDLINYSMSIESDCGNYGYCWVPTPEHESFLKLCTRFDEGYLLCKISSQTIVDAESTWKCLKELIEYRAEDILDDEQDWDIEEIKNACYSSFDERCVHDEIEYSLKHTKLESEIEDFDIWECIQKDYPCNAKKIASVYCIHIIPAIKEKLKAMTNTPYNQLTDSEIIKAFECCTRPPKCDVCPCRIDPRNCKDVMEKSVLNLINRQNAKLIKEQNKNSNLRNERNRLQEENKRLKERCIEIQRCDTETIETLHKVHEKQVQSARAEAYKKCIEEVKETSEKEVCCDNGLPKPIRTYHITEDKLDNLLKEKCNNNVQDH